MCKRLLRLCLLVLVKVRFRWWKRSIWYIEEMVLRNWSRIISKLRIGYFSDHLTLYFNATRNWMVRILTGFGYFTTFGMNRRRKPVNPKKYLTSFRDLGICKFVMQSTFEALCVWPHIYGAGFSEFTLCQNFNTSVRGDRICELFHFTENA